MYKYVLLNNLEVRHANAMVNQYMVCPAIPMTVRQFSHALAMAVDAKNEESGAAIVYHDVQMLGQRGKYGFSPQQRRGAVLINNRDYPGGSKSLSMQPVATMHLRVSVVIRFSDDAYLDSEDIERFLHSARLGGGVLQPNTERPHPFDIRLFDDISELSAALKSGYLLIDRRDLLEGQDDILKAFSESLTEFGFRRSILLVDEWADKKKGNRDLLGDEFEEIASPVREMESRRKDRIDSAPLSKMGGTIIPTTLGYIHLEGPLHDVPTRGGYPAVFSEPAIGFVEFVKVREYMEQHSLPFWDYAYLGPDGQDGVVVQCENLQ